MNFKNKLRDTNAPVFVFLHNFRRVSVTFVAALDRGHSAAFWLRLGRAVTFVSFVAFLFVSFVVKSGFRK
jgi:hypothetical protein